MGLDIRIPLGMMFTTSGACSRDSDSSAIRRFISARSVSTSTVVGAGAAGVRALMLWLGWRAAPAGLINLWRPCPGRVLLRSSPGIRSRHASHRRRAC